ncbi:MAG: DNA-processing protein DprA [Alphaproteobacteria bacterium]|nr:DNA-processing protein DprA [Alphaproteobacteria bacterium]
MSDLNDKDIKNKIAWLQLIRTTGIGPLKFWQLIKKHGSVNNALEALDNCCPYDVALAEYKKHTQRSYGLLAAFEKEFPQILRKLPDCPPVISVCGDVGLLNKAALAIVGARNASLSGRQFSEKIARDLGAAGWVIVSGLARGIDDYAHRGSLASGTVAVVAGGIDQIYPPEHKQLYEAISKQGIIISEMPFGMPPAAYLFPRRNRIIAALSHGVVVIEAAMGSGSLITAQYASEQGTEVFAVPGSPLDPRSRGCNYLLKQGAVVTESVQDVLNAITVVPQGEDDGSTGPQKTVAFLSREKEVIPPHEFKLRLLADLGTVPISVESLLSQYDCPLPHLLGILTELEMNGQIQWHSGSMISLVQDLSPG